MPHRGLIGARKSRQDWYSILRLCRDYLELNSFREIMPTIKAIVLERDKAEERLEALTAEFNKKKIGFPMKIRKRRKLERTKKKGVLYFNKQHIGKRVIVWEKVK